MSLHDTYQRKIKNTFSTVISRQILILLLTSGLAAAADKPELQKIRYTALSASSEQVTLQLNGSYIPKVFTLKDETPRIIFDFPDMIYGREVQGSLTTNGAIVKRIRVGMHTGEAPKTRIVFDVATLTGVTYTQKFDNTSSTLTIQVLAPGKTAAPDAKIKAAAKIVDDKKSSGSETTQAQPQSITETQSLIKTEAAPGAESQPATIKETSPQLTEATKEQKSQEMPMVPAPPVASVDYKTTAQMKTTPAESEAKPQPMAKETPAKPVAITDKTEEKKIPTADAKTAATATPAESEAKPQPMAKETPAKPVAITDKKEEKKIPTAAIPTPPEATADVKTAATATPAESEAKPQPMTKETPTKPAVTSDKTEEKKTPVAAVPTTPEATADVKTAATATPAESEAKPQPIAKETPAKPVAITDKKEEKKTPVAAVPTPPEATADVKTATKMEAVKPATIAGGGPMLESVKFDGASTKGEMVLFKLNDFHPPVIHGVEEGVPRIICEFNNTQLADSAKNLIKADGKYVKVIRISKNKKPDRIRVVLDLEPNHSYDLQQIFFKEDNLFVIIVNRVKK